MRDETSSPVKKVRRSLAGFPQERDVGDDQAQVRQRDRRRTESRQGAGTDSGKGDDRLPGASQSERISPPWQTCVEVNATVSSETVSPAPKKRA